MALPVVQLAVALLGVALLALALVWIFRFVQYRRAVQLSHARWLPYDADGAAARLLLADGDRERGDEDAGGGSAALDWASLKPFLLSPIPEERLDSGRESETDSLAASSVRKDRRSAISIFPCASLRPSSSL